MADENNNEGGGAGAEAPKFDHFGEPIKVKGTDGGEQKKEEPKLDKDGKQIVDDKGGKKDDDKGGKGNEDISTHPTVVALNKELADLKKNLGGNLGAQGKIIKTLTAKLEALTKGGAGAEAASADLYKDIKRSKDLTKAERDEMTENEIKQFDEIADLKDGLNKIAKMVGEKTAPEKKEDGAGEDGEGDENKEDGVEGVEKVDDLGKETRAIAMEMAGHDIDIANKIVHEFNQFAGNDKLNKTELAERLAKAAKLVPDYKAPKESSSRIARAGSSVKTGNQGNADPFGTTAVIDAVKGSQKPGGYKL